MFLTLNDNQLCFPIYFPLSFQRMCFQGYPINKPSAAHNEHNICSLLDYGADTWGQDEIQEDAKKEVVEFRSLPEGQPGE